MALLSEQIPRDASANLAEGSFGSERVWPQTALVIALTSLVGCAGTEAALKKQAAADLKCSQVQIRVAQEPDHVRSGVASGCDLEIAYTSTCWGPWKMDFRGHLK